MGAGRQRAIQRHAAQPGGDSPSDFSSFIRRSQNWGINLERPKYNVGLNWNHRGRQGQGAGGGTAEPGTYADMNSRLTLVAEVEYRFSRRLGLFSGGHNITGEPFVIERYGSNTPPHACRHQCADYGIALFAGVERSFEPGSCACRRRRRSTGDGTDSVREEYTTNAPGLHGSKPALESGIAGVAWATLLFLHCPAGYCPKRVITT